MAKVAVVKSDGDYPAILPRLLALAEAEDVVAPGDFVLIKPNLHAPQHWTTAGTTHPALVAALVEWARAEGARRVLVADGPYYGLPRPGEVFTGTGMAEIVEDAGAEWTVFVGHPFRLFHNASPHLPAEVGVSELVFQCNKLINVALMKTHMDCLVTLGMKNLKGCIRSEDKRAFHRDVEINRALVALNRLIAPDLTIVDGTLGMEGIGPHAGRPAGFGHVFASRHTPSVDAVAASAMGVEIEEARTLRYAVEEGLLDPASIRVVGEDVSRIRRRFERPYEAMMRELPGLRLQMGRACSACKLNVIRALRENRQAGVALPSRLVVIGNEPPAEPEALLIGQCQREHAAGHHHLPGCPPSVARVKEFVAAPGG
ncbi:MAG TPA: DUF362 domain-containing protein [Planctomycetota bacterium]|nr:DUF362 domain-containing protein [Planctomycetota bacterium]